MRTLGCMGLHCISLSQRTLASCHAMIDQRSGMYAGGCISAHGLQSRFSCCGQRSISACGGWTSGKIICMARSSTTRFAQRFAAPSLIACVLCVFMMHTGVVCGCAATRSACTVANAYVHQSMVGCRISKSRWGAATSPRPSCRPSLKQRHPRERVWRLCLRRLLRKSLCTGTKHPDSPSTSMRSSCCPLCATILCRLGQLAIICCDRR
jgi:hypothetical protein